MQIQTIKLSGLTCSACKKITERRIGGINGVRKVDVALDTGVATIESDREITESEIKEILKDTPYKIIE